MKTNPTLRHFAAFHFRKPCLLFALALASALTAATGFAQTQLGADITFAGSTANIGWATAVSGDGSRVVVTDRNANDTRVYDLVGGAWTQVGSAITGTNGSTNGAALAINTSGSRIAIGEPYFSATGTNPPGRVRVFDLVGGVWTQVGTDLTGVAAFDQFGWSVDLSGSGFRLAVGARQADVGSLNAGRAFVYDLVGSTWTLVGSPIDGTQDNETAGASVALSADGQVLAVGSPAYNNRNGRVRAYTLTGSVWQLRGTQMEGAFRDNLGWAVDLTADGSTLAASSIGFDASRGRVMVYDFDGANYAIATNVIEGEERGDFYSRAVDLSADGRRLVVTAEGYDDGNQMGVGRAYAYERVLDTWLPVNDPITGTAALAFLGYGAGLSADGTTLVVGAVGGGAQNVGLARVFRLAASPYTTLPQPVGMTIEGGSGGLGGAIAMSADGNIVASAVEPLSSATAAGRVRVDRYVNGAWTQVGQTLNGAIGDKFGWSIALSDDGMTLAVGAPGASSASGVAETGYAQVYSLVNNVWTPLGSAIPAEFDGDECGTAVALSADGSRLAVGSPQHDNPNYVQNPGNNAFGQVRIYDLVNGAWTAVGGEIEGQTYIAFAGTALAFSADGNRIVVGSPGRSFGNDLFFGAAHVYDLVGGAWMQVGAEIVGDNARDAASSAVAISNAGDRIIISTPFEDADFSADRFSNEGRITSYDLVGGAWTQTGIVRGAAAADNFGRAISLSGDGNRVLVGSAGDRTLVTKPTGKARVYEFTGASWTPMFTQLDGENPEDNLGFATGMSDDGLRLAVGAPGYDGVTSTGTTLSNSGAVYVYSLSPAAPLPVELTEFSAVAKTRHVALAWTTAQERNASHFALERSADGVTWTNIATVAAAGDTDEPSNYSFPDDTPLAGANYYRLRQVDIDGAEAFSGVEVVHFAVAGANLADVRVYPNPARDFIAVTGLPDVYGPGGPEGPSGLMARLLDVSGREVAALGVGESRMSLAGVPAGVYALVVESETGSVTRRIVVE